MEALEPGPVHTPSLTMNRILAASAVTAMTAGSAFVWYFNPSNVSFFPVCPLYSLTGLACPGCGLTRGFHALFHGDISDGAGLQRDDPGLRRVFRLPVYFDAAV